MKITAIIERLKEIKQEFGDIDIEWIKRYDYSSYTKFIQGASPETKIQLDANIDVDREITGYADPSMYMYYRTEQWGLKVTSKEGTK